MESRSNIANDEEITQNPYLVIKSRSVGALLMARSDIQISKHSFHYDETRPARDPNMTNEPVFPILCSYTVELFAT